MVILPAKLARALGAVLLVVALAGCTEARPPSAGADPEVESDSLPAPPPVRIVVGQEQRPTWQGSYCWQEAGVGGCVDTTDPRRSDLVDAGDQDWVELVVDVPLETISAQLTPLGRVGCATPTYDVDPVPLGDGHYRLEPAGPAGEYQVQVWGRAAQGEVPGTFRWSMPAGPVPEPEARMSLVWEPDGELEGQGFLLSVSGLPPGPREASAKVTVTAGDGEQMTFDAGEPHKTCRLSTHLMFIEDGTDLADRAARLGPTPFEYAVDLTLDGEVFHGAGTYPEPVDTDPDNDNPAPVLLDVDPALSTYGG